ncbi:MAG: phospholipase D-like domain-containing protein [Elusimicrobiales bacterium]|nr:phospholipase D-like domain-containing protein [Elusimicrobiales bacterium]
MREKNSWRRYCAWPENALAGNDAALLRDGEEAFPAMLSAIGGARDFVLLEFYAFSDDFIGRAFADLLKEKLREGVRVYLIYDSVGSILTDRDFFLDLAAAGARVAEFRPVIFWKPYWNWIKRDHRKMVCVDGRTAFVGGFNVTEYDAPRSLGGRGWKDAQVRLAGPAVASLEKLFWQAWEESTAVDGAAAPRLAAAGRGPAGDKQVSVLFAGGIRNVRSIRRSYRHAIDKALDYIYITNAYFLPDRLVYRRLVAAARRGVDVRVIAPMETDHPYVRWASWARYAHLIRNGVKIYEWQGPILHSKTAVIDGLWSSVGSHNLDHRSLHYNLEVNLNVYDEAFGAALARAFKDDLKNSRQVTLAEVKARPWTAKLGSKLLYLFRSWL